MNELLGGILAAAAAVVLVAIGLLAFWRKRPRSYGSAHWATRREAQTYAYRGEVYDHEESR